jgi:uncharacterized protein (DUF58 family)
VRRTGAAAGQVALAIFLFLCFAFAPFRAVRLICLFSILMIGIPAVMSRLLPRAVSVLRRDPVLRVNRMQTVSVGLEVRNRWPLPLRSVLIADGPGRVFPDQPPVFIVDLAPREKKILTWEAEARERGEFTIGPAEVSGPGPFGLRPWVRTHRSTVRLIVYPAVFPVSLEHTRGLPAGSLAVANRLYEDVSRFRSLREYIPGDELRRINWKVSARLGKLHTMEYLPSLYFPVLVLLNLAAPDYPLEGRHHLVERAIEVAASLVVYFIGLKQEVGLAALAKGMPPATVAGSIIAVPIRAGTSHGVRILEELARAGPTDAAADFTRLAGAGGVAVRTGTRILAVTPPLPRERRAGLHALARKGWALEVFFVTSSATATADTAMPGVVSHVLSREEGMSLHA